MGKNFTEYQSKKRGEENVKRLNLFFSIGYILNYIFTENVYSECLKRPGK